ncbi:hypothetical protein CH379_003080 [Leptospira ellisii]|uniref:Lipoprotein n=1 Tax=Leptospira ellisii TaxID=2023197 RepID=A0A2N0B779_9LEPT|nr:hypothetical protein [Leptospira ellisii]MDV6234610.1 hypothetical protein [Leptospira ellisii]PJZ92407.1 hypothetical protein CH379_13345 [Leptospira ellisii]
MLSTKTKLITAKLVALVLFLSVANCKKDSKDNNLALLAGLLLANQYEATVSFGGKLTQAGTYTKATGAGVYPANSNLKPAKIEITNPADGSTTSLLASASDFTVAFAPASGGNDDAGDYGLTIKLNSPTTTLTGKIYVIPDSVLAGACPALNSPCDVPANYSLEAGTFNLNVSVDSSNASALTQVTVSNYVGNDISAQVAGAVTAGNVSITRVLSTVKGVYSNPNPTIGENKCDGFGVSSPEVITGVLSTRTLGPSSLLQGTVSIPNGVTVTVPAGAVVFGDRGSSLFVLNGGNLVTQGTAVDPVCFTSSQAPGSRFPGDWGGIVMIGNGISTRGTAAQTEGSNPQLYGTAAGNNAGPGSGTFNYTIVEFAGNEVAPGDELNGISLYTVTNQTVFNYVQVHRGLDDSFEWWGGAFQGTHLLGTGGLDDDFDMDEGFQGTLTSLIGHKYPAACGGAVSTDPHGMEMDGSHSSGAAPVAPSQTSSPTVNKFTLIGQNIAGGVGQRYREGMQGNFSNGLIYGFAAGNIRCDNNTAGGSNTDPTVNATVFTEAAKTDPAAGSQCLTLNASKTLAALPIVSEGSVPESCGFGAKPDYTSVTAGRGAVPDATKWYDGWTVYRGR